MCDCLNFDKQLDEVRCICAIYPDQVIIEDKEVKKIVFSESNLANGTPQQSKQYHNHPIDFYYICKDKKGCVQYETYFSIDKDYPATKLDSHVRIYNRPKQTQTAINNQLATLISSKSDVDVFTVIVWINERMEDLDHVHLTISEEPENTTSLVPSSSSLTTSTTISTNSSDMNLSRLWIVSHHIYSKKKRKTIIDGAKSMNLRGFMKPGKPGLICLEGPDKEVEELWKKIRLLRWQKIRAIEKENLINKTSFETFEELNMDQAKFVQFLKEKDLNHIAIYDFKLD